MRTYTLVALSIAFAACAETRQTENSTDRSEFNEQIVKYETTFRPSDYDAEPGIPKTTVLVDSTAGEKTNPELPAALQTELVQGFRVQLFSTTSIDEGKAKKAEVEAAFPGEWFYLEYDPPAYKVRAGNFLTRYEAEGFVKLLGENGYNNAWTVPARVYKNPPPPTPK